MAQRRLLLTVTALCVLVWAVWAKLDINMEDRVEVFKGDVADISCMFMVDDTTDLPMEWLVQQPGDSKIQIYNKSAAEGIEVEGTSFSGRIKVSHSQEGSILTISSVQLSDEQQFTCRVSTVEGSMEGHTQLLVFNPPSFPSVEVENYISANTTEPEKVASCKVEDAYPSPNITWYKNGTPLHPSDHKVKVMPRVTVNPSGLFTMQSELNLQVVKDDKDAKFYCEVSYFVPGAQKMMESKPFHITVHYSTTNVTMDMISPKGLVKEGDRVEIRCQGNGNPQPILSFRHNDKVLQSENELLVLQRVTRADGGKYECTSLDPQTFEEASTSLDLMVHYLDSVVITPEDPVDLEEGQDLNLTCNALSSLSTQITWYKNGDSLTDGVSPHVLTLETASYAMAGMYVCVVEASNLPELRGESSVNIVVKGEPLITGVELIPLDSERLFNLSCYARGHPEPNITWRLTDNQVPLSEWSTVEDASVLSIITVTATPDITVFCEASNELGSDIYIYNITAEELQNILTPVTTPFSTNAPETVSPPKRHRKEGSGVIIAVIIILILLLAILGSVLYFLYKKGKIPYGRAGKQDLTKQTASKDDIVVEMKSGKSEEAVLLQGVNGDKKVPNDQ